MHTCDAAAPAKNVFGVDLTEDENNTRLDGACFVTARVDAAQEASLERALQAAQAVESTTRLPWPLRWGKTGAAALALLFVYLSSLFFSEDDPLFLPEARFCLAGAAGFGLLYGLLRLAARRRSRRVRKSEAAQACSVLVEKALLSSAAALGVPEKAETVDAIFCPYRRKKKALRASSGTAPHLNRPFRVFCADGALCFADAFHRLSLPLEDLTALRRVNRRLCVLGWNKDVPYNKGVYKPYQITVNSAGLIFFKPYYVLTLTSFGREFELWIPPYDLPAVQSVLESGGRSLPVEE